MILALTGVLLATAPMVQADPVEEMVMIEGAGTELSLEIRGRPDEGPILLHLHGGPGNGGALVLFRAYAGPALESEALVGYLHQRGVLGSPAVPDSSQTIDLHVADVVRAVDYLNGRFPCRPIVLLGHSWGGLLAVHVALEGADRIAGIVNVSGPFDMPLVMSESYDQTLAWAKRAGRTDAIAELETLGPPPYANFEDQFILSKWSSGGNGGISSRLDRAVMLGRAPYLTLDEAWVEAQLVVHRAMYSELFQASTTERLGSATSPLLVLAGGRDLITPSNSIRESYEQWAGPKSFVEMAESHHLPFVDQPEEFVQLVMAFMRSLGAH